MKYEVARAYKHTKQYTKDVIKSSGFGIMMAVSNWQRKALIMAACGPISARVCGKPFASF